VSITVAVCVKAPLVPVIVSVAGPAAFALGLAFTVNVVPFGELVGLNEAVVLGGKPLTENVTALLNPFCLFTVTLYAADCRAEIVWLGGVADTLKSAGGAEACTTSATCVLWLEPLVPVIVSV